MIVEEPESVTEDFPIVNAIEALYGCSEKVAVAQSAVKSHLVTRTMSLS